MKHKSFIYLIAFIFVLSIFYSCEKEDDSISNKTEEQAESPSEGSPLSAEAQKGVMETTGIALNDQLTTMMKSESMEACVSFSYFLTYMEEQPLKQNYENFKGTEAFSIIQNLSKLNDNEVNVADFLNNIREVESDPESFVELYESLAGKYTWDAGTQSWSFTENDKIIFEFPSSNQASSNDAAFVVDNVSETLLDDYYYFGQNSWNEYPEDAYTGYIPTGLHFYLEVGDTKAMEYEFSLSFNDEGFPSESSVDFTLGTLNYSSNFKNKSSKEINTTTTLKNDDTKLIEFGAGIEGDINQDNIDNNILYYAWDTDTYRDTIINAADTADYEYYWPEPDPKEILNKGFAYFTVMDRIKLGGKVAIKNLIAAEEEIYPLNYWDNPDFDHNQATADWVDALNEHTEFFLADMQENTWMAKADFFVKEETHYQETYSYVALRFKFSDDSRVDPEVYFGEGFDDFIQSLNNSMQDIETTYSSYDF